MHPALLRRRVTLGDLKAAAAAAVLAVKEMWWAW